MTGFKNFFSHKSFRQKLLFTYIGIILIPLGLITGFIFGNIATTIKKTTQVTAYRSHLQALAYLDSILINMKNSTNTILYDEKFLNFFSAEDISVGDQTQMYDQTVTFLKITERSRALKRIRFFVDDRLIFSNDKRVFFPVSEAIDRSWAEESGLKRHSFFTEDQYLDRQKIYQPEILQTISYVAPIPNMSDYSRYSAIIVVDMDKATIARQLEDFDRACEGSFSFIVDSQGNIICSSQNTPVTSVMLSSYQTGENWISMQIEKDKGSFVATPISMTEWSLVTFLPDASIRAFQNNQLVLLNIITIIITGLVLLFAWAASKANTKRIDKLTAYALRVQKGDFTPSTEDFGTDEIGQLCDAFNYTIIQVKKLMDMQRTAYERMNQAELKMLRTELEMLQTQINPHFLYNTLSMINWTAAKYDCDEVEQQILLLSSYYKGCLSSGETLVSIEDEVKTVSLYIQLHSIRSGLDIAFQSDIEEVKHYKIPKLTLQPLIENSIMHGIMQKPTQSGTIQVIGEIDEDTILLKILDDGVGFVQKDIDNASNSKSYGMKNVSTRLKLYFGEDCGVFCNPTGRQQGAVVTVKLKKEPLSFLEICRE